MGTTLIVSSGIISKPRELVIIEVAVFLLVAWALVINRLTGLSYRLWNPATSVRPMNERSESRPVGSLEQLNLLFAETMPFALTAPATVVAQLDL